MTREPRLGRGITAGETGFRCGGAEGIRTPDLLIANETRYQLRHSPMHRTNQRGSEDTTRARPARIGGQPPTACWEEPSAGGAAVAASATSALSAASRPELDTRGSVRSIVRTERLARGLLT